MIEQWSMPVKIGSGRGYETIVHGPQDALAQLGAWPGQGGWFHERAKSKCHAAIEMGSSLEEARRAFVAAAIERDVPFA